MPLYAARPQFSFLEAWFSHQAVDALLVALACPHGVGHQPVACCSPIALSRAAGMTHADMGI